MIFLKITFEGKNGSQSSFFKDKGNHVVSSVDGNLLSFNFKNLAGALASHQ